MVNQLRMIVIEVEGEIEEVKREAQPILILDRFL
jgi:hypothetical protein